MENKFKSLTITDFSPKTMLDTRRKVPLMVKNITRFSLVISLDCCISKSTSTLQITKREYQSIINILNNIYLTMC